MLVCTMTIRKLATGKCTECKEDILIKIVQTASPNDSQFCKAIGKHRLSDIVSILLGSASECRDVLDGAYPARHPAEQQ